LKLYKAPQLLRAFWSPEAAVEAHDKRKTVR
jgi:hypothetical protein